MIDQFALVSGSTSLVCAAALGLMMRRHPFNFGLIGGIFVVGLVLLFIKLSGVGPNLDKIMTTTNFAEFLGSIVCAVSLLPLLGVLTPNKEGRHFWAGLTSGLVITSLALMLVTWN